MEFTTIKINKELKARLYPYRKIHKTYERVIEEMLDHYEIDFLKKR